MPTNNLHSLLAQDIPDPTDFSATDLRRLDASCRCAICGEFFDAPISLACGHCFCSLCIREHLTREAECPGCRKSATEAHFRLNLALEEVVSAWKAARPNVLHLSREERPKAGSGGAWNNNQTPRRLRTPVQNARKRRHTEVSESSDSDVVCVAGPSNPAESSEMADFSPLQAKSSGKVLRQRTSSEPSSDPTGVELQPDSRVRCPVCFASVEFQAINAHMDGPDCSRKLHSKASDHLDSSAKNEWSKLLGGGLKKGKNKDTSDPDDTMERLPKVSYDVLKDKTLKNLLISQGLPLNGDRNARIVRHRRWVMVYNANLDKTTCRKTLAELRDELKTWEDSQKGSKYTVDNLTAHETSYREQYNKLIEDARPRSFNCQVLGDEE